MEFAVLEWTVKPRHGKLDFVSVCGRYVIVQLDRPEGKPEWSIAIDGVQHTATHPVDLKVKAAARHQPARRTRFN